MTAVEVQTPFGHPIPPAQGHSPDYSVTTHIPQWETVAQFSAKVAGKLIAPCTGVSAKSLPGSEAVREAYESISSLQAQPGGRSCMLPCRMLRSYTSGLP